MDKKKVNYRICTECSIHHFDNCGSCFGFGVYSLPDRPGELFPVTAHEAMVTKQFRGEVQACLECGSTVLGIPDGILLEGKSIDAIQKYNEAIDEVFDTLEKLKKI